jgi:hypothetical protein
MFLRTLILKNCLLIDDFCLSKISGLLSETLETLDLTGIKALTDNGLLSLGKLK